MHVTFEGLVEQTRYSTHTGQVTEKRFFENLDDYAADPDSPSGVWTFEYDAFGRPITVTQTEFSTDGGYHPTASREVETQSDAQGRIARITSPEGILGYDYDILGRKTRTYTLDAEVLDNNTGNVSQATLESESYGYDSLGRLQTVTVTRRLGVDLSTPEVERYTWDLPGNLIREDKPNGVITIYEYDSLNRLDKLTHYRSSGGPPESDTDLTDNPKVAEFDYTVRADGQRTGVEETFWLDGTAKTQSYSWTYDGLNRLIDEVFETADGVLDYHTHYDFDLTGNRLNKIIDRGHNNSVDETTTYTYDANDRALGETRHVGTVTDPVDQTTVLDYDHTQQTGKTIYSGSSQTLGTQLSSLTFTYDLQGRILTATNTTYSDGVATSIERTTYDYDVTGIRVSALTETDSNADSEFESSVLTQWLNDPQNHTGYSQVLRETHTNPASGDVIKVINYTIGLDQISQTVTEYSAGAVTPSTTSFFLNDGHGSVRALLDAVGAIATIAGVRQLYHFDANGNAVGFNLATAATTYLYNSEPWDQHSAAWYFRRRIMSDGRFVGLDPFAGNMRDPLSFHKYLFVHANPIAWTDPSGLSYQIGGFDDPEWDGMHTQRFGYSVEEAVEKIYRRDFPMSTNVTFGRWARLPGILKIKPDILDHSRQAFLEIRVRSGPHHEKPCVFAANGAR